MTEDNELCRAEFEKWSGIKVSQIYLGGNAHAQWLAWQAAWNRPQSTDGDEVSRLQGLLKETKDFLFHPHEPGMVADLEKRIDDALSNLDEDATTKIANEWNGSHNAWCWLSPRQVGEIVSKYSNSIKDKANA